MRVKKTKFYLFLSSDLPPTLPRNNQEYIPIILALFFLRRLANKFHFYSQRLTLQKQLIYVHFTYFSICFLGLATGVVPLYLGEISPRYYRGGIGVISQLLITIGKIWTHFN